ncbi:MAG TPA: type II secretion system protein GspL [Noviherbaspirillum sp.]
MSTLYIRLPSKAAADSLAPGMPLYCQYASASGGGAVEREGVAALSDIGEIVAKAQRVVLLLAASDVTLLRVKVPPLSAQKLRVALPNLVEDQLMSDPAECVIVPGETHDGLHSVGVVSRAWLELLARTLLALGARRIVAVPSQLCLPQPEGTVNAAVMEQGDDIEVALRMAAQEGMGLSIQPDQRESAAFEVIQSLSAIVPHSPITLYVPQSRVRDYQDSLHIVPGLEERITLHADNWPRWITGADKAGLDLMSGLGAAAGPSFNWRPWRWPIGLALAALAVNAAGLNIDWLRMKREADALRSGMIQTYRNAFPKDNVIVDPLAQLRQKMDAAKRDSGQLAPDDFVALAAAAGDAISSVAPGPSPVAAIEYHDRSLTVKLKQGANVPEDKLRAALATRNLSLSQPSAGNWQIRSAK